SRNTSEQRLHCRTSARLPNRTSLVISVVDSLEQRGQGVMILSLSCVKLYHSRKTFLQRVRRPPAKFILEFRTTAVHAKLVARRRAFVPHRMVGFARTFQFGGDEFLHRCFPARRDIIRFAVAHR